MEVYGSEGKRVLPGTRNNRHGAADVARKMDELDA
jgi:hypothetical protein